MNSSVLLTAYGVILQIGGNARSTLNEILSNWGVPIIGFLIVCAVAVGLVYNLEKIIDSKGQGTRKEGFMNMAYIIGGVLLTIAVLAAILSAIGSIDLSI